MPEISSQKIAEVWCGLMHESVMWPTHGHYQCRTCGREYSVPWNENGSIAASNSTSRRQARQFPWFRSALLPLILATAILWPVRAKAAEPAMVQYTTPASRAFALYLSNLEHPTAWASETVEIDASLPKLKEAAHFRAIRTLQTAGKPD